MKIYNVLRNKALALFGGKPPAPVPEGKSQIEHGNLTNWKDNPAIANRICDSDYVSIEEEILLDTNAALAAQFEKTGARVSKGNQDVRLVKRKIIFKGFRPK